MTEARQSKEVWRLWVYSSALTPVRETFPVPSTSEKKQLYGGKKYEAPPASTQIYFRFSCLTPVALQWDFVVFDYNTNTALLPFESWKNAFFAVFYFIFFFSVMAKKEWSHFIPIQHGAREKWFGLNRTTVLLLFCPARRLYRAQQCWIQSYSCGSWFHSKFSVKRYFPLFPFAVWSVLQTCARS